VNAAEYEQWRQDLAKLWDVPVEVIPDVEGHVLIRNSRTGAGSDGKPRAASSSVVGFPAPAGSGPEPQETDADPLSSAAQPGSSPPSGPDKLTLETEILRMENET
jgi:hypothetical protein